MVTSIQEAVMGNGKPLVTVYCLSTDSKPTNVANGSTCIHRTALQPKHGTTTLLQHGLTSNRQ